MIYFQNYFQIIQKFKIELEFWLDITIMTIIVCNIEKI